MKILPSSTTVKTVICEALTTRAYLPTLSTNLSIPKCLSQIVHLKMPVTTMGRQYLD